MRLILSVTLLFATYALANAQSNTFPSSGSVGIGTTSPSYNLDVNGSWAFRQNGYFYNSAAYAYESSTNQYLHFQTSGGKGYLGMTSTNDLILQTYGGKVGIGTSSPEQKLDVRGNLILENGGSPVIYTGTGTAELNRYVQLINSPGAGNASGLKAGGVLIADSYSYANPGKNDLVVKGNVGIGTANPIGKVSIKTISSSALVFERSGANVFGYEIGGSTFGLYDYTNSQYRWRTNNADVLLAETSGNVGIGTTSPDSKLTVKGVIHAEEVKVDLAVPGPDYVFDENYPLRSLEDTKTFIDQNKHLPGIPSSDEMQQNGVNLLEMNMKLLEKVEELTLHLIEQNSKNQAQEEKIETLQAEVKTLKSQLK